MAFEQPDPQVFNVCTIKFQSYPWANIYLEDFLVALFSSGLTSGWAYSLARF